MIQILFESFKCFLCFCDASLQCSMWLDILEAKWRWSAHIRTKSDGEAISVSVRGKSQSSVYWKGLWAKNVSLLTTLITWRILVKSSPSQSPTSEQRMLGYIGVWSLERPDQSSLLLSISGSYHSDCFLSVNLCVIFCFLKPGSNYNLVLTFPHLPTGWEAFM